MAVTTWDQWAVLIGSILSTLVLTVAAVNRWIVQPLERNRESSMRKIVESATLPINNKLDTITREVEVNSGKSLKDKVITGFSELDDRLGHLEGQVDIIREIVTKEF